MLEIGDYRNLEGFRFFAAERELKITLDKKRRCYRLTQRNDFIDSQLDAELLYKFKAALKNAGGSYFEDIHHPFPRSSYCLIDARALEILHNRSFLQAVDKIHSKKVSLIRAELNSGKKQKCFKVEKAELASINTLNTAGSGRQTGTRECSLEERFFKKSHLRLNKAMYDYLKEIYHLSGDKQESYIWKQRCLIKADGEFYRLYQLDNSGNKISITPEFKLYINLLKSEQEQLHQEDDESIIFNSQLWQSHFSTKWEGNFASKIATTIQKENAEAEIIRRNFDKIGRRIWQEGGNFRTCLDSINGIYISSTNTSANIEAFNEYLHGHAYIRRKKPFFLPIMPSPRRHFLAAEIQDEGYEFMIDGPDDAANAINNTGLSREEEALVQLLGIFPVFLCLIKLGVDGLGAAKYADIEALAHLRERISLIEEMLADIVAGNRPAQESVLEIIQAMGELPALLRELEINIIDANASAYFGHPAMISMFLATAAFELSAFCEVVSGQNVVTNGYGSISTHGFISKGADSAIIMGGVSLAVVGQVLMTCFASLKVASGIKSIALQKEEINKIRNSDISQYAKNIILAIEKDTLRYKMADVAGNATLAAGQMIMAGSGPTPAVWAGLALTLVGIGTSSAAQKREQNRYASEEVESDLRDKIATEYNSRITEKIVQGANYSLVKQAVKEKIYAFEIIMHIDNVILSVDKILRNFEDLPYLDARKETKDHYQARQHQHGLYLFTEQMDYSNRAILEKLGNGNRAEIEYIALRYFCRKNLIPTEDDLESIISLATILERFSTNKFKAENLLPLEQRMANYLNNLLPFSDYADLVVKIQNAYMSIKLDEVAKQMADFKALNPNKQLMQLTEEMLDSEISSEVKQKLLETSYKSKERRNIDAVGKIHKSGGTGIFHWDHEKTIYKLRQKLDDAELPTTSQLKKFLSALKFNTRSDMFETITAMKDSILEEEDYNRYQEMVKSYAPLREAASTTRAQEEDETRNGFIDQVAETNEIEDEPAFCIIS